MTSILTNEVRRGLYADSVALMRLSRSLNNLEGVAEAAVMMATPANKDILRAAHLLDESGRQASAEDLIIAVRAESRGAAQAALEEVAAQLARPLHHAEMASSAPIARNLRAAIRSLPDATLALISVPGHFAVAEARKAIRSGLHTMIFSDNVPIEEEVAIKQEAQRLRRLVMGPDCGTAIVNGHPLAFANVVERGDIGVIGASGTGMQEVTSLISQNGRGISQALGVGGRDLSERVGGIMTMMAIGLLEADPQTQHLVLISKPPHPNIARKVLDRVARSRKTFTICFVGAQELQLPKNAFLAPTLTAAAEHAAGKKIVAKHRLDQAAQRRPGKVWGLFSGGTLCAEAQIVLLQRGRRVASNAPVPGATPPRLDQPKSDCLLDLGADEYTRGRPHPMIDPAAREAVLRKVTAHDEIAVILLDVVIGFGAHPDPTAGVIHALNALPQRPRVVASVTGTEQDPQVRSRQIACLEDAGILVESSNAHAAALAASLCG